MHVFLISSGRHPFAESDWSNRSFFRRTQRSKPPLFAELLAHNRTRSVNGLFTFPAKVMQSIRKARTRPLFTRTASHTLFVRTSKLPLTQFCPAMSDTNGVNRRFAFPAKVTAAGRRANHTPPTNGADPYALQIPLLYSDFLCALHRPPQGHVYQALFTDSV